MNARQKAKKYKKELERFLNMPIRPVFVTEPRNVKTIRVIHTTGPYEEDMVDYEGFIFRSLCCSMAESEGFQEAVKMDSMTDEFTGNTIYTAEIKVLG